MKFVIDFFCLSVFLLFQCCFFFSTNTYTQKPQENNHVMQLNTFPAIFSCEKNEKASTHRSPPLYINSILINSQIYFSLIKLCLHKIFTHTNALVGEAPPSCCQLCAPTRRTLLFFFYERFRIEPIGCCNAR